MDTVQSCTGKLKPDLDCEWVLLRADRSPSGSSMRTPRFPRRLQWSREQRSRPPQRIPLLKRIKLPFLTILLFQDISRHACTCTCTWNFLTVLLSSRCRLRGIAWVTVAARTGWASKEQKTTRKSRHSVVSVGPENSWKYSQWLSLLLVRTVEVCQLYVQPISSVKFIPQSRSVQC